MNSLPVVPDFFFVVRTGKSFHQITIGPTDGYGFIQIITVQRNPVVSPQLIEPAEFTFSPDEYYNESNSNKSQKRVNKKHKATKFLARI